ncbi:MAG: UDP-N-acetylmuramate dehydrogenase [Thermomicrobiales bacterium]|nr:UDP-N-acetylmuramate dehydrogenase [Thermomicrobiales bacterium]
MRGSPPLALPTKPDVKLFTDAPLSIRTTWRIGGPADYLVLAADRAAMLAALEWADAERLPVTIFGGGSNLLAPDGGLRGLVICSRTPGDRAENLLKVEELGDQARFTVGAQAPLTWTGRAAANLGWAGLDWGVGLPGTIGGATVNNAGAHGTEMKDHLETVTVLDLETGRIETHPGTWLESAYRYTAIKAMPRPRRYIVLEVSMLLPKGDRAELLALADHHAEFRDRTQPTGACGGSTFANPYPHYAGKLIEDAGLKGFMIGPVGFSTVHANFIVNEGGGTAAQVRELIATAQQTVRDRFGVELHTEIEDLGEPE